MSDYYVDGELGDDSNPGYVPDVGYAWATIGHALASTSNGDVIHVKASITYSFESGLMITTGAANTPTRLVGYAVDPGDGGRATIQATDASSRITFANSGGMFTIENFILDGNSQLGLTAVSNESNSAGGVNGLVNCLIQNWKNRGVDNYQNLRLLGCEITGCGANDNAIAVNTGVGASTSLVAGFTTTPAGAFSALP